MVLLTAVPLSCGGSQGQPLDGIRDRGFVRAAYSPEPPYAFLDSTGAVRGESPDALRRVVAALELGEIRWVQAEFAELIPLLEAGRVDVVAAGMFRTKERARSARFSIPTVCPAPALVVRAGSSLRSLPDVAADTAARLAVIAAATEGEAGAELGIAPERILAVPSVGTGIAAVADSTVDAFAVTYPTARRALAGEAAPGLEVRAYDPPARVEPLVAGCSALVFRYDAQALAAAADSVLARYLASDVRRDTLRALGFVAADAPTIAP